MDTFDYIVVGAGSAGCAVAARLSEDTGIQVAVVEAGSHRVPPEVREDIATPWRWGFVQQSVVEWAYESVPQPYLEGRRLPEPQGRLPGGTSNLYILMHIRGHRSDHDNWAYNGCPGWAYDDVLPYFQKLEDQGDGTSCIAGKGGPLRLQAARLHEPNPTSEAFSRPATSSALRAPRTSMARRWKGRVGTISTSRTVNATTWRMPICTRHWKAAAT